MKIIKSSVLTLLFMMLSCSQNEALEITSETSSGTHFSSAYQYKETEVAAENVENPYDVAGFLNSELSAEYFNTSLRDSTQSAIIADVVALANSNVAFQELSQEVYFFTDYQTLNQVLSVSDCDLVLSQSIKLAILDIDLQIVLDDFIHYIMENCANEVSYGLLYHEIVAFERSIQNRPLIHESDRRVVLNTTSILRHQIKQKRKRPKKNTDRDWDYMITTLGATAVGAKIDIQNAIILSLLTEISITN